MGEVAINSSLLVYLVISLIAVPTGSFITKRYLDVTRTHSRLQCWIALYDDLKRDLIKKLADTKLSKTEARAEASEIYDHIAYLEKAKEIYSNIKKESITKSFLLNIVSSGAGYLVSAILINLGYTDTLFIGIVIIIMATALLYDTYTDLEGTLDELTKVAGLLNNDTTYLSKSSQLCEKIF